MKGDVLSMSLSLVVHMISYGNPYDTRYSSPVAELSGMILNRTYGIGASSFLLLLTTYLATLSYKLSRVTE